MHTSILICDKINLGLLKIMEIVYIDLIWTESLNPHNQEPHLEALNIEWKCITILTSLTTVFL